MAPSSTRYGGGWVGLIGLIVLETWVVSAFGTAQPLLSLLGANQTFFVAHETRGSGVVMYALVLLFVVPAVIIAVELLAGSLVGAVALLASRLRPAAAGDDAAAISSSDDTDEPTPDRGSTTASSLWMRRSLIGVHVVALGVLASAALTPVALRSLQERPVVWSVLGIVITVVLIVAIARLRVLTTFIRALGFAPVLFGVYFLFLSPASTLVSSRADHLAGSLTTRDTPPLIWLVFDEGTLPVIVDADGDIDANRFPNFARLAQVSTWYPYATAGTVRTDLAVPAALSGTWPRWNQTPIDSEYPSNLFTLLAGDDYPISAHELITYLCPETICDRDVADTKLWSDTRAVYLRYLLPEPVADRFVPRIDRGWNDFGETDIDEVKKQKVFLADVRSLTQARVFVTQGEVNKDEFSQLVDAAGDPDLAGLHYTHLLLPHEPMRYLPDGREITLSYDVAPDPKGYWPEDEPTMRSRLQRVVAQTMLADRLVGQLLDALEESGNLERTALVVMGDHGGITRPGSLNRPMTNRDSMVDVTSNIVMIKAPGQSVGRVDDRRIQQVDMLPTVLEMMGFDGPTIEGVGGVRMDGLPATDEHLEEWVKRRPMWLTRDGLVEMDDPPDYRDSPVTPWIEQVFGNSTDPFRMTPDGDLVGHAVDVDPYPPADRTARFDKPELFVGVDMTLHRIPAYVSGVIDAPIGDADHVGRDDRFRVAVVVNGRIGGIGESFVNGAHRFALLVDPSLLRSGDNDIALLVRPLSTGGSDTAGGPDALGTDRWWHMQVSNER